MISLISSINYKILLLFLSFFYLQSCGLYRATDAREVSPNAKDRVQKNVQEGRGFRVFDSRKKSSGEFEFASSNPLWRATINLLDFAPFSNVDYSGGIIITDWYNGDNVETNEFLKITVRFLSNEIRADGLDVIVHKKKCSVDMNCEVESIKSKIQDEIITSIIKKAAILEKEAKK